MDPVNIGIPKNAKNPLLEQVLEIWSLADSNR